MSNSWFLALDGLGGDRGGGGTTKKKKEVVTGGGERNNHRITLRSRCMHWVWGAASVVVGSYIGGKRLQKTRNGATGDGVNRKQYLCLITTRRISYHEGGRELGIGIRKTGNQAADPRRASGR